MNPLGLQAQLYTAAAAAAVCAALLTWGLYWRGEYRDVKAVVVALQSQEKILVSALKDCNAGAAAVKSAGDEVRADVGAMLAKAQKLAAPRQKSVERIETIIERPAKPGEGCDWAWDQIEAERQKARATP